MSNSKKKRTLTSRLGITEGQLCSLVAVLAAVATFVFCKLFLINAQPAVIVREEVPLSLREHSSVIQYDVPGKNHTIDFTFYVNDAQEIEYLKFTDVTDPDHQGNVDEFEELLFIEVQGKKLSEIGPFDMIGTSTLTTGALNEALADIQAAL